MDDPHIVPVKGHDASLPGAPPQPEPSPPPAPAKPSRKEANILVRKYLRANPDDYSIRKIAAEIGMSAGFVCGLPAWMARPLPVRQVEKHRKPNKHERRLTKRIAEMLGSEDDIFETISAREAALRYLCEKASTDEERQSIKTMPPEKRNELIEAVLEQFQDQLEGGGGLAE